jgi:hypothetical protein
MRPHELYEVWAPLDGKWSPWAKPVLFLHLEPPREVEPAVPEVDVSWAPRPGQGAAIIVDLPGARAVSCAFALAKRGYRPVPLYNTHANPTGAIDLSAVLVTLRAVTAQLPGLNLAAEAPPAFLLDANRLSAQTALKPPVFDNRWMVFPQDFPSASLLLANNLRTAVVVQDMAGQPRDDLRHVLLRWQEAGIEVRVKREGDPAGPETIEVSKPSRFRSVMHRWTVLCGLRRNAAGGFGSIIPEPSSGGGGFA